MYSSKIIADSYANATRITTFEVTYPSHLHAEVVANSRDLSVTAAGGNVQRPMSTTRAVITGTNFAFSRFFTRYPNGSDTMWALHALAALMRSQLRTHEPVLLVPGDWHLPYIDKATVEDACLVAIDNVVVMDAAAHGIAVTMICRMLSVARCAAVANCPPPFPLERAYHDRRMAFYANELDAYRALLPHLPQYGSAFEHQASPDTALEGAGYAAPQHHGNLPGWEQYRMMFIEAPLVIEEPAVVKEHHNG